jgi:hypothetical protein
VDETTAVGIGVGLSVGIAVADELGVAVAHEFGVAVTEELGVAVVPSAEETGTGNVPDDPPLQPALAPARARSNSLIVLFITKT